MGETGAVSGGDGVGKQSRRCRQLPEVGHADPTPQRSHSSDVRTCIHQIKEEYGILLTPMLT